MQEPKIKVICQVCDEVVGVIDLRTVKYPLTAEMFESDRPERGVQNPFYQGAEWEFFRCPFGPHRPMLLPDHIRTELGILFLPADGTHPRFTDTPTERDFLIDRESLNPLPPMSDAEAEMIARQELGEQPNGKTEEEQGQQTDDQPVEKKKEVATKPNLHCYQCGRDFKNRSGLLNHSRLSHKITEVEVIDHAR